MITPIDDYWGGLQFIEQIVNPIDITIVAGRRPELIQTTLISFQEQVFDNFEISQVIVNIDPFGNQEKEGNQVRDIILDYFPSAKICMPARTDFCLAVRSCWMKTKASHVFHIEDDWEAVMPIRPQHVFPLFTTDVKELSLMCSNKNWNQKHQFDWVTRRPWYFPVKLIDKNRPKFSTSPAFWDGNFLRRCAKLMDINFDPEKQFFSNVNPRLEAFVAPFKNRFLVGEASPDLITDIGCEWRKQHGIEKRIVNSKSIWVQKIY